ncbi:MAG: GntR family transcriptional regulator [Planctomycetota bacterium]|nr:GntR family transcriptional regulator [Planctomycetota bacterium]
MVSVDANSPVPKYRQLADQLEEQIRRGDGEVGKRFLSEREIIRQSGVSIITVRQALDTLTRKGLLRREPGIGTFLVRREPIASDVKRVALIVFSLAVEMRAGYGFIYSEWMKSLLAELKQCDQRLELLDLAPDMDTRAQLLQYVEEAGQWSGFVFGAGFPYMKDALKLMADRRIPHVVLDDFPWLPEANAVYADHVRAGELATEHLLALGHRRIAFAGSLNEERHRGYQQALRRAGIEPIEAYALNDRSSGMVSAWDNGARAAQHFLALPEPPTAIFTSNDARALGVLRYAQEKGLCVPRDLSVVGVDEMPEGAASEPALTTIRWPWTEMGRRGAQELLAWIRDGGAYAPKQVALEPALIAKQSSGPAPART